MSLADRLDATAEDDTQHQHSAAVSRRHGAHVSTPAGRRDAKDLVPGIRRHVPSTTMPSRPLGRRHIAVGLQSSPLQQDTPYLSFSSAYQSWPSGSIVA